MKELTALIRQDETFGKIENGKCNVCGEPYALITGSNTTFRKDGRRYAQINCAEIGWGAFRCSTCKEVIEETWIPC
jgi:formate dehydrogenase maturation protein FdhE